MGKLHKGSTRIRLEYALPLIKLLSIGTISLIVTPAWAAPDSVALEFALTPKGKMVRASTQWRWDRALYQSDRLALTGYWEANVAGLHESAHPVGGELEKRRLGIVGLTPLLRLQAPNGRGPYAEFAIGVYLFSQNYHNAGRDFSTAFQFGDSLAVGYSFAKSWDIAMKVQHFSNAGVRQPNPGVNFLVLKLGRTF